jgi:hypothetical protein
MNNIISETQTMWLKNYTPLWTKFWRDLKDIDITGCACPHLPICGSFDSYDNSKYKIAFVGIDAYGWGNNLEKYTNSDLENYLEECQTEMDSSNWSYNNPLFWNFIFKFLGELHNEDWRDLKKNPDHEIVKSLIWANTNSIGKEDSKTNMTNWDEVKSASMCFDKAQNIINIFNPKIIFLLNWNTSDEWFPDELGNPEKNIDGLPIWYYHLNDNDTHIFWTKHPRGMLRHGTDKIISAIRNAITEKRIFDKKVTT